MGMNNTNQYKLPAVGQGKMGKHEFEWTIYEKWALVKFPGMLQEGMCDLEIECSIAPNGYFDLDKKDPNLLACLGGNRGPDQR